MARIGTAELELTARTAQFVRQMNSAAAHLRSTANRMRRIGRSLSTFVTLPLLAIGAAAFKIGEDFETALARMEGLVGIQRSQIEAWRADIRSLAIEYGSSAGKAADALFFITSAGLRGDDAMEVLEASLKASASGLGEVATIADLATSAMNAYGAETLSATEATDVLTAAVREGKIQPEQLAGAIGQVLPLASAMGVSFDQVGAAMAAMSRTGTNASMAAVQLRQILSSILNPTVMARDAMREMGLSAGELRSQLREQGLLATLQTLQQEFEGNDDAAALVFGNIRALSGVLDLMGSNAEGTAAIFEALTEVTGDLDDAFSAQQTATLEWQRVTAAVKDLFVELWSVLGDRVIPILVRTRERVQELTERFGSLDASTQNWAVTVALLAGSLGPLLLGLSALTRVVSAVLGFGLLGALLRWGAGVISLVPMVKNLGDAWAALRLAIGPVIQGVTKLHPVLAVIGVVLTAGILIWRRWGDEISRVVQAVVTVLTRRLQPVIEVAARWATILLHVWLGVWNQMKQAVTDFARDTMALIQDVFGFMVDTFSGIASFLGLDPAIEEVRRFVDDVQVELDRLEAAAQAANVEDIFGGPFPSSSTDPAMANLQLAFEGAPSTPFGAGEFMPDPEGVAGDGGGGAAAMTEELQASQDLIASLQLQITERKRMLAAIEEGVGAAEEMAETIAREQAVRDAVAEAVEEHADQVARLAGELFDLAAAEEEAAAKAREVARAEKEAERIKEQAAERADEMVRNLERQTREQEELLSAQLRGADAVRQLEVALAGEAAVRRLGEDATEAQRRAVSDAAEEYERARQSVRAYTDEQNAAREAEANAERGAQRMQDSLVGAAENIARAFGGVVSQIASVGAAIASGGLAGGIGAGLGAITNLIGGNRAAERAEREAEAAAVRDATEALNDFAASLREQGEFEAQESKLAEMLEDGANALLEQFRGLLDEIPDWTDLDANMTKVKNTVADMIASGDFQGAVELMAEFGLNAKDAAEFLEENNAAFEALAEARAKAKAEMEDEIAIRTLEAQGRNEEAEAMKRQLQQQETLDRAMDVGGEAMVAMWQELFQVEAAARAASEALTAQRQAQQDALTLAEREAALRGDDRGALSARLTAQAQEEINALEDRLAAGEITEEFFNRMTDVINGEVNAALEDFDEQAQKAADAAREAARAEQFRAEQDMRNLEVRLLTARGMDNEAFVLKQQIELLAAVEEGRSKEYIAMLEQIQAIEAQNRAQQQQQRTQEKVTQGVQRANREMERQARLLNAPSGTPFAAGRFRAATAGMSQPTQVHTGDVVYQIYQRPGESTQDLVQRIDRFRTRNGRAGGPTSWVTEGWES